MKTETRPTPDELLQRPVISVIEAGIVLGIARTAAYEAVNRGDIPHILVNGRKRVPTARLKALLNGHPVASGQG